jgi:hypothetical protein
MKHVFLALFGLALSVPALSQSSDSKIKAYLRGGVNYNLNGVGLDSGFTNAGSIARLERPVNGWHAGLTVREQRNDGSYLAFESLYSARTYTFQGTDLNGNTFDETLQSQSVQLALSPGFRLFKLVRAQAGINALFELNDDFKSTFANYQLGYRLGVGLDLGKSLTLDVALNSAFNAQGGTWNGLQLSNRPSEYLVSVGYKL